ncbi:MAG: hypothetical protein KGL39_47270 [Patescibacteria group bacterium]|nr:hypothetical protein [Patescibacteria group bacterium]
MSNYTLPAAAYVYGYTTAQMRAIRAEGYAEGQQESAARIAELEQSLTAAANYIDTLGGVSKSYRIAVTSTKNDENPDFLSIPVEYQYCYPDGHWHCSNGKSINGDKPVRARALYARKDEA